MISSLPKQSTYCLNFIGLTSFGIAMSEGSSRGSLLNACLTGIPTSDLNTSDVRIMGKKPHYPCVIDNIVCSTCPSSKHRGRTNSFSVYLYPSDHNPIDLPEVGQMWVASLLVLQIRWSFVDTTPLLPMIHGCFAIMVNKTLFVVFILLLVNETDERQHLFLSNLPF